MMGDDTQRCVQLYEAIVVVVGAATEYHRTILRPWVSVTN